MSFPGMVLTRTHLSSESSVEILPLRLHTAPPTRSCSNSTVISPMEASLSSIFMVSLFLLQWPEHRVPGKLPTVPTRFIFSYLICLMDCPCGCQSVLETFCGGQYLCYQFISSGHVGSYLRFIHYYITI